MNPSDRFITVEQAAAYLGCSKGIVYKCLRGQVASVTPLRAIRLGRRKIILRETFENWVRENNKVSPTANPAA